MKQKQSSRTAEGMAIMRAIEAAKPEGERLCYDPFARSPINGFSFLMSKLTIASGLYGLFFPGAAEFVLVRERYIDDFLQERLREGLDQVVILGAGFDTRAYRIAGIEKTRVFEVDHPATQADKLQRLQKVVNPLPAHVSFVAVDFNSQTLADRLRASGYDEDGETLFIWQGVTMYLTPKGVDGTLAFIAGRSGPGSAVIFDYFYTETLRRMKATKGILRLIGERLTFGIDEGQIVSFLSRRGCREVHSADGDELSRLYLTGPNVGRPISPGVAIASARVDK